MTAPLSTTPDPLPWDYVADYGRRPPPWRRLLVERLLRLTAERTPTAPALIAADHITTWRELDELADRAADGLARIGAHHGDIVALSAGNTPATLAMMFGMSRAGVTVLPINPMNSASEIAFQLADSGAKLLLSPETTPVEAVIDAGRPNPTQADIDENAPFWVRFTSGTTGKPRCYSVSHRAISLLAQQLAMELNYRSDDRMLVNAPLAHAAFAFAAAMVVVGGSMRVSTFDAESIWNECDEQGITQLLMVPTMLAMALDNEGSAAAVRRIALTGSELPAALRRRATQRFPAIDLTVMYGASELGMVTALHGHEVAGHGGSVGLARFGYSIRILDDDGNDLPRGEIGTIYVQGPSMGDGFIGSVPAPPNVVRNGWVTPGDMGYLDEDGFLYLADRRSDLIISGGLNVYPAEVENALLDVQGVREVAVVGLPDEKWGQRVTAVIVGDVSVDILEAHCRTVLARYKIPRRFEFVETLPKSPTGKLLRRSVRDNVSPQVQTTTGETHD
jgi:acyl-CoA synthetase (AMP-forming)/AMP-acid ligase II